MGPRSAGKLMALAAVAAAGNAQAAEFDARGVLQPSADAVFTIGFEDPQALVDAGLQFFNRNYQPLESDLAAVALHLETEETGGLPALEGSGVMHIRRQGFRDPGPIGFTVNIPPVDGTLEVRIWARAEPGLVTMYADYVPASGGDYSFAAVTAVPTGRRTSDDWVEFTSGPLEPEVMGRGLTEVMVTGQFGDIVLDALEVRKLGNRRVPADTACTAATVKSACGAYGECIFGRCVESAAVYGAVPATPAHRREYAARLSHVFNRLHANRQAVQQRGGAFHEWLRGVAESDSPRTFWGGITQAVNFFRDGHTNAPVMYTTYYSSLPSVMGRGGSGVLGACLGLTELDLRGGEWGYTVFSTDGTGGLTGTALQRGDILHRVDGEPAADWVRRVVDYSNLGSDARSDAAFLALELPGALSTRASVVEFLRCESTSSCTSPTTITVPVAAGVRAALGTDNHLLALAQPMECDGRFLDGVANPLGPNNDGYDQVSSELVGEVMTLQFDGVAADEAWDSQVANALMADPARILVDTRLGNGGYLDRVSYLVSRLRDDSTPQVAFGIGRPWQETDPTGLYDGLMSCLDAQQGMSLFDGCSQTIAFSTQSATASALGAKVAWLNTADISGNDYLPRMLKGRDNLRIFGPVPTAGAFGAVIQLPPLTPGEYYGGSIQVHDTRFAATREALATAPYSSGTGVEPDEISLQKLSDSLSGTDTMLTRARAWLMETP